MFIALLRLPSPSARNSFYSGTEPHNGHAAATVSMRPLRCERLHIASSNTTTSSGTTASIDTMKLADSHSDRLVRTPSIGHEHHEHRLDPTCSAITLCRKLNTDCTERFTRTAEETKWFGVCRLFHGGVPCRACERWYYTWSIISFSQGYDQEVKFWSYV